LPLAKHGVAITASSTALKRLIILIFPASGYRADEFVRLATPTIRARKRQTVDLRPYLRRGDCAA